MKVPKISKDVIDNFDAMRKSEQVRKKHKRVRCPHCGSISRVTKEINNGYQFRECRNGHSFTYSYTIESYRQCEVNYKTKKKWGV